MSKVYMIKLFITFFFITLPFSFVFSQTDSSILIKLVNISGYKHTKVHIISRQLSIQEGDVFENKKALEEAILFSKQILTNTGLFRDIDIAPFELQKNVFVVNVVLKEAWNFYPIPYFQLADRNFNVWWVQQKRALNRVNLGVKIYHRNVVGYADALKLTLSDGYNRTYRLDYRFPYLDKSMKWGVFGKISYQQWREINYDTKENKQLFYRKPDNSFLSNYFLTEAALTYRPAFQSVHTLLYGFQRRNVDAAIAKNLNPDYLLKGDEVQHFSFLRYVYQFDDRDNRFYPWDGYFFQFEAEKSGIFTNDGRNALTIMGLTDIYKAVSPRLSLSLGARGKYSFIRNKQPYYDNRALGFSEFTTMRGYEYYLVDGLDLAMLQTTARLLLFQGVNNYGKLVFIDAFRVQPYKVYLTLHSDWGIVNNPFSVEKINPLDNKLLWSYGVGINIKLYFDMVARIEYSRNIEKGDGIFLNFNASF
jgi:outer membrane protein assembly factor BamA